MHILKIRLGKIRKTEKHLIPRNNLSKDNKPGIQENDPNRQSRGVTSASQVDY